MVYKEYTSYNFQEPNVYTFIWTAKLEHCFLLCFKDFTTLDFCLFNFAETKI